MWDERWLVRAGGRSGVDGRRGARALIVAARMCNKCHGARPYGKIRKSNIPLRAQNIKDEETQWRVIDSRIVSFWLYMTTSLSLIARV